MSKVSEKKQPEMLPEYNFEDGLRGKYAARYVEGSNIVVLAPDVAAAFPTEQTVNEALRLLMRLAQQTVDPSAR